MKLPTLIACGCLFGFFVGCSKQEAPPMAGGHPVTHWLDELKSPNAKAHKKAVKQLGRVGTADPAAIPAVIGALRDADHKVRAEAALALGDLGPDATEAIPALTEATHDRDAKVREHAAGESSGPPLIPTEKIRVLTREFPRMDIGRPSQITPYRMPT